MENKYINKSPPLPLQICTIFFLLHLLLFFLREENLVLHAVLPLVLANGQRPVKSNNSDVSNFSTKKYHSVTVYAITKSLGRAQQGFAICA